MRALRDFQCKKCEEVYEEFAEYDESGKYPSITCPKCGSKRKSVIIGVPSFNFTNPVGTKRWNNGSTGHDYRYKHKAPSVKAEREFAEKHSHVGPNPYGDV